MILYTMGFTQKSAREFFGLVQAHRIDMLVDIRLNNTSQLAGFTKGEDLRYFLQALCGCRYQHCAAYAPTKELLDDYKKGRLDWEGYVRQYIPLMESRQAVGMFYEAFSTYDAVCLLCSEPTPQHCHRRLLAEMIAAAHPDITIQHI